MSGGKVSTCGKKTPPALFITTITTIIITMITTTIIITICVKWKSRPVGSNTARSALNSQCTKMKCFAEHLMPLVWYHWYRVVQFVYRPVNQSSSVWNNCCKRVTRKPGKCVPMDEDDRCSQGLKMVGKTLFLIATNVNKGRHGFHSYTVVFNSLTHIYCGEVLSSRSNWTIQNNLNSSPTTCIYLTTTHNRLGWHSYLLGKYLFLIRIYCLFWFQICLSIP